VSSKRLYQEVMSVWFFLVAYGTPSSALGVAMYRLVKSKNLMVVARVDSARAQARAEAAEQAAMMAEQQRAEAAGLAAESVAHTGQALLIARQIDKVSAQMDVLLGCVTGEPVPEPSRRGRHALPGGPDLPAIAGAARTEVIA
jgi:hypothetical protein